MCVWFACWKYTIARKELHGLDLIMYSYLKSQRRPLSIKVMLCTPAFILHPTAQLFQGTHIVLYLTVTKMATDGYWACKALLLRELL